MTAGESASERAAKKKAVAERYRMRAARAERVAKMFETGAAGELTAAGIMNALTPEGYYVLHDRCLPGSAANIDHVLIGPAGVFVIDTKNWNGELTIEGNILRQNGRRRDRHVELVRDQAVEIATMLDEFSISRAVRPVICFVGSAAVAERVLLERVHLLRAEMLLPFVHELPILFDQETVERLTRDLENHLPPRVSTELGADASAGPSPPDEMVVLVQPWRKAGRARLYVKDVDGGDAGFIDLITGEITAEPPWTGVLSRLSHHYSDGVSAESDDQQKPGPLRNVFRAFTRKHTLASEPPLIVAYHWQNHGHSRLYVHRVDGRTKAELGYFDVENGVLDADTDEAKSTVRYCGERFRTVVAVPAQKPSRR